MRQGRLGAARRASVLQQDKPFFHRVCAVTLKELGCGERNNGRRSVSDKPFLVELAFLDLSIFVAV